METSETLDVDVVENNSGQESCDSLEPEDYSLSRMDVFSKNNFKNGVKKVKTGPKVDENDPDNRITGHDDDVSTTFPRIMNCTWCQKNETSSLTMECNGSVQSFCTELCFTLFRRASYKKNRVCDWCKHVRHTVNYVGYKEGMHHLLFCSDKCMNQYKMNVFKNETDLKAAVDEFVRIGNGSSRSHNGQSVPVFDPLLLSPEAWIKSQKLPIHPSDSVIQQTRSNDEKRSSQSENGENYSPRNNVFPTTTTSAVQSSSPSSSASSGGDRKRKRNCGAGQMNGERRMSKEGCPKDGKRSLQVTKVEEKRRESSSSSLTSSDHHHGSRHQSLSPQYTDEGYPRPLLFNVGTKNGNVCHLTNKNEYSSIEGNRLPTSSNDNDHECRKRGNIDKERVVLVGGGVAVSKTGACDNAKNNVVRHSNHKSHGSRNDNRILNAARREFNESNCKKRKNGHSNGHHQPELEQRSPAPLPQFVSHGMKPPFPEFLSPQYFFDSREMESNRRPELRFLPRPFDVNGNSHPSHGTPTTRFPERFYPFDHLPMSRSSLPFPMPNHQPPPSVVVPIFVPIPIPVPIPFPIPDSLIKNSNEVLKLSSECNGTSDQISASCINQRRRSHRAGIEGVINKLVTKRRSETEGHHDESSTITSCQSEDDLIRNQEEKVSTTPTRQSPLSDHLEEDENDCSKEEDQLIIKNNEYGKNRSKEEEATAQLVRRKQ